MTNLAHQSFLTSIGPSPLVKSGKSRISGGWNRVQIRHRFRAGQRRELARHAGSIRPAISTYTFTYRPSHVFICPMSRSSTAVKTLPTAPRRALEALGENLRVARERRGESLRAWALRLDASVPTLRRMEAGDPSVGIGVYATALWACGLDQGLADLADPSKDGEALEIDIVRASKRRNPIRSP